jgi:hypothetical protein
VSHVPAVAHRARPRSRRLAALVGTATLLAAGCRGDSVTTPSESAVACANEPGCRPSQSAPVDAVVLAAVADARERLIPMLDDASAGATLALALQRMSEALEANRSADARARLADVYVVLDRLRVTVDGGTFDLPDVSAIRLALVPAANALGVQAR